MDIKKIGFSVVVAAATALLFTACGETGTTQGTPLAHHKKVIEKGFDPVAIPWRVDNGEGLRIYMDNDYIYLQFDHTAAGEAMKNIQFIIDIDNNSSTGNRVENGADYIVENGYLYQSLQRDVWDWYEIGKVESSIDALVDTVRIKRTKLQNMHENFGVGAQALNDKWEPVLYSPSMQDEEGNHLKTTYIP